MPSPRCLRLLPAILLLAVSASGTTPDNLPRPADQVMLLPDNAGDDIGLPLGATSAYAIGRSLQQQGENEAALVFLNRAYRLAPESRRIALSYAASLVEAGFINDAARIYGDLVVSEPDSLDLRREYSLLLAQAGRPHASLQQVRQLREQGEDDPGIIKLEADLLGQLDRVDDAIEIYRDAMRRDPERAEEYILAAGALLQRKERFDEMAALLREGLKSEPASHPIRVSLIRFLVHRGRLDEARAEAIAGDRARREKGVSDRPECRRDLADLLAARGDYETAASVLESVREDGIHDRDAEIQLARYHLGLGRVEVALDLLPDIAARWPGVAEVEFLWGRALDMQDDYDGAVEHLRAAIELEPSLALYRVSLLRLMILHDRADLAAENPDDRQSELRREALMHAAKASVSVHPQDAEGHMILGYAYRTLGDLDRAARQFHMAGDVNETRVAAMLELGFTLQEAGRMAEARKVLGNLQREFPDDAEVANSYGYFLAELGEDLEHAEELVRQALLSDPENGAYLDSLGWVLHQAGRDAEAFEWLVKAVNDRPGDPVILEHLAVVLRRLGKLDEAVDILDQAIEIGGDRVRLEALRKEIAGER